MEKEPLFMKTLNEKSWFVAIKLYGFRIRNIFLDNNKSGNQNNAYGVLSQGSSTETPVFKNGDPSTCANYRGIFYLLHIKCFQV